MALVPRHGLSSLGSRPEIGIATKPGHGGGSWCHNMRLVLRQGKVVGGVTACERPASSDKAPSALHAATGRRARLRTQCARSAQALCTRPTCCSALFGSLCGTLFMDTIPESLLKKKSTK